MSSPITFSGFNSIDFNMILESVMTQERRPLTALETKKTTLQAQNTLFSTLTGRVTTMASAVDALKAKDSLSLLKATSSDAGVGVSSTGGTLTGTYEVVVSELARAQVSTSSSTFGSTTATFATGGTLTLTPADGGDPTEITVTAGMTLQQLAQAINSTEDTPAKASIVQVASGDYRLVLTGTETGTDNAFTLSSDIAELAYPAANTQDAVNAAFTVNGLAITSNSNTVSDVIDGVTLSLTKKDPANPITVKVEQDISGAKAKIEKFMNAYNDLIQFSKDQQTAAIAGRTSIGREPLLRGLRDQLRNTAMQEFTGGTFTRLAEIGIGFDLSGKMVLDSKVFEEAMETDPIAVQNFIAGEDGDGGVFQVFSTMLQDYTKSGGLLSASKTRIDTQVSAINNRLDSMESALATRRAALQKEYIAADLAMTRLKAQSSSLSAAGSGYRLF